MQGKAHCVIMAGGSGTRFWPLSRRKRPKQLLNLAGKKTLLQETVSRVLPLFKQENIHVISGEILQDGLKSNLSKFRHINYIFEPKGRNTAPCIGYMALKIAHDSSPKDVLVIMPSDHLIQDGLTFRKVISAGIKACLEKNTLVTIGIKPKNPHTGYGYIKMGRLNSIYDNIKIHNVDTFKEKPDLKTAEEFLEDGAYLWNSGIFIAQADFLIKSIKQKMPELYKGMQKIASSFGTKKESFIFKKLFPKLPAESIDYGVIEKISSSLIIPSDFGWNDLGSWNSLEEVLTSNNFGVSNSEKVVAINSSGNIIHTSDNKKIIALLGIKDLTIVETKDAILISDKNHGQEIKKLVEKIKQQGLEKYL